MTRYVLGFAFDETESRLALLLKARPEWMRGHLNGIGGHIEEGETPLTAMLREWGEEVDGGDLQWREFAVLQGEGWRVHCFRAAGEIVHLESFSEGEDVVFIAPDQLPPNVVPNLSWLVPMARMRNRHDWPFTITERAQFAVPDGEGGNG